MTEEAVQVSLDGLLALQSAANAFARAEIIRIADAVIADLRSKSAVGIFDEVAARHMWDEYCWNLQEGPFDDDIGWDEVRPGSISDNWDATVRTFVSGEIEELPHYAPVFLSAYAFEENADCDETEFLGSIWIDGIVDTVIAEIKHRARERNLELIGPDRGDIIRYEIQGSGMVWSALSDRDEARDLIARHIDAMIDPDADLSGLADEIVEAFIAAITVEADCSVLTEFLDRFESDVRSLLLKQDVRPSLDEMRGALIKRLDGAPSVVSEPIEVPVNKWEVNQAALRWLKEVNGPADPQVPYVLQLATWGLEEDKIDLPRPIAPSQPTPEAVKQVAYGLGAVHGREQSYQAMRRLFSNPDLSHKELMDNLDNSLSRATTPEGAAQMVIEVIYDLMVATSP